MNDMTESLPRTAAEILGPERTTRAARFGRLTALFCPACQVYHTTPQAFGLKTPAAFSAFVREEAAWMASDPRVQEALRAGRDEVNGALVLYRCRGDRRPVYLILADGDPRSRRRNDRIPAFAGSGSASSGASLAPPYSRKLAAVRFRPPFGSCR